MIDTISLVEHMLRGTVSRNVLLETLQDPTIRQPCLTLGCVGGYLNTPDAVVNAERLLQKKTSSKRKPKTRRRQRLLELTHGAQYCTWWKHNSEHDHARRYREALEKILERDKGDLVQCPTSLDTAQALEQLDLFLECALTLGQEDRVPRGVVAGFLEDLGCRSRQSEAVRHTAMLLGHFDRRDATVRNAQYLQDAYDAGCRRPDDDRARFEYPVDAFPVTQPFERLMKHVVEDVLGISDYRLFLPYVRIKDQWNAYTKTHTDYKNVVSERACAKKEDAPYVRTVWVALHDIPTDASRLCFTSRRTTDHIPAGTVYVFDLNEPHYATFHRHPRPRISLDFRIQIATGSGGSGLSKPIVFSYRS